MASAEHLQLSSIIKDVHRQLREDTTKLGESTAWSQHLQRKHQLQRYSEAMQLLATTFWSTNTATRNTNDSEQGKEHNRIEWAVKFCFHYFVADLKPLLYQRERELRILSDMDTTNATYPHTDKVWQRSDRLKLLDVGSCYNPFAQYEHLDVTAVDIAPANLDVHECDFLSVTIVDANDLPRPSKTSAIQHLAIESYDIVVFSLLLEYMPTSAQRMVCCRKAYEILRPEGLLIVITPDSKHVGANARLMKNWRYTLARIGFSRIKIEKLEHITCMVFRRAISKAVAQRWAELHREEWMLDAIQIPQELGDADECDTHNDKVSKSSEKNVATDTCALLSELPNFDVR